MNLAAQSNQANNFMQKFTTFCESDKLLYRLNESDNVYSLWKLPFSIFNAPLTLVQLVN